MRIQWSSAAVLEMLTRLRSVEEETRRSLVGVKDAFYALREANEDGSNRALSKLELQLEENEARLRKLNLRLQDFSAAIRKADASFCEAEQSILQMGEEPSAALASVEIKTSRVVNSWWKPEAYRVMPSMRVGSDEIPAWLGNAAFQEQIEDKK